MTAPNRDATGVQPPTLGAVGEPLITAPVAVESLAVASVGGVPLIAFTESIEHYSGRRLTKLIMDGYGAAGFAINPPQ